MTTSDGEQRAVRMEHDSLGDVAVPASALYGAQTQRAVNNFPISGMRAHPAMIQATVLVKKAAALANMETGRLDERIARAIAQAADEILAGQWHEHFVVDVYQAGAGTSHNMNANEVLANRAIELLGGQRGDSAMVHANDHVNMAQSTNDTFPTAMRVAALLMIRETLPAMERLAEAFEEKGREFDGIVKSGRTHLQDATPIRLGQEFAAYGLSVRRDVDRLRATQATLCELNIGGTAVGTGLNAEPAYIAGMVRHLSELTGFPFRQAESLVQIAPSMSSFVEVSGALRVLATDLTKIANDIRLLASGPATGLYEIILPPVQPGSSIMPGKINPSMAEMLNQVCFQVLGYDTTVTFAAQAGQLELNVMMPVLIHNVLWSLTILKNAMDAFTERCVRGIIANKERCEEYAFKSASLVTALAPYIGYEASAKLAKEQVATGRDIRDIVREHNLLPEEDLVEILRPAAMTEPGVAGQGKTKTPILGHASAGG
ncbi:MAG: Fumarate hydratase class II [Ktedonobacterales bacterium]|jgi:aspartate ammonia-lyase|nr:MAG: Fumarate hydratase class II [Ktedonobacterales bacterium]